MNLHRPRPTLLALFALFVAAPLAFGQQPNPFNNPNNAAAGGAAGGAAGAVGMACGCVAWLFALAIIGITIASLWVIFTKAGKPGWAAIVPIYNIIVLLEIIDKPLWWIVLFFIPCANFVVAIMVAIELAKKFGKDTLYGVGMAFLPFIFYPMLAFGNAQYIGHSAPPQDY